MVEAITFPAQFSQSDERAQPQVPIPGYAGTALRNPSLPFIRRPVTRTEITGPLDLARKLSPGDSNLAVDPLRPAGLGAAHPVAGRILDEDGRPVPNAVVEIWQANAAGRYRNPLDQRDAPLDPNFIGNGRVRVPIGMAGPVLHHQARRVSRPRLGLLVAAAAHPFFGVRMELAEPDRNPDVFSG